MMLLYSQFLRSHTEYYNFCNLNDLTDCFLTSSSLGDNLLTVNSLADSFITSNSLAGDLVNVYGLTEVARAIRDYIDPLAAGQF